MNYYHVFWTRPYFKPGQSADSDIVLWDFELLIWLLSALQLSRYAPLRLITDKRGALAAERAGLSPFYKGGISTDLDDVPPTLNSDIFWAGGKLYAYGLMEAPWVCVDQDAVLWQPLSPRSRVMALHREGRNWGWYNKNQESYSRFGFEGPEWSWDVDPFNTGVIYIADEHVAQSYSRTACAFVEAYSIARSHAEGRLAADQDTMLFAEQRLLPMCAARHGVQVLPVTETQLVTACLPQNPECLHLWRAKLAYKICAEARVALINWAIHLLVTRFPESRPVLAQWHLDKPLESSVPAEVNPADFRAINERDLRFSLLRNVTGAISIHDLATGITRPGSEGSMVWSGEALRPEPGASFELEVIGLEPFRVAAMPAN